VTTLSEFGCIVTTQKLLGVGGGPWLSAHRRDAKNPRRIIDGLPEAD
jgi:hypothetical protein